MSTNPMTEVNWFMLGAYEDRNKKRILYERKVPIQDWEIKKVKEDGK